MDLSESLLKFVSDMMVVRDFLFLNLQIYPFLKKYLNNKVRDIFV